MCGKDIPVDLFKIILEKSTDINAQDINGETALHWAIIHLSGTATKELLAHKDVDVKRKLKRKFYTAYSNEIVGAGPLLVIYKFVFV